MKNFRRPFAIVLMLLLALTTQVWGRDWTKDPPWVEIRFAPKLAVVGDVHGAWPQLAGTLEALGFARRVPGQEFRLAWTGGTGVLVFVGDYGDRGEFTHEVYDTVMDLEAQALKAGGRVVPTFGNHEALLLNGTVEKWAKTLKPPKQQHYQNTLDSFGKTEGGFHRAISAEGRYGAWIRRRPLFAIINGWMFVHGGLADPGQTRSDLGADFREAVEAENWNGPFMMGEKTVLWHRQWWNDDLLVQRDLKLLGVRGVVFGHTIGAMGEPGKIISKNGKLVAIDVGMCPAIGPGKPAGLLISADARGTMTFQARYGDGTKEDLFQTTVAVPAAGETRRTGTDGRPVAVSPGR